MRLPNNTCQKCPNCNTITEDLILSISFCPKCSPIIYDRRRRYDITLIRENRALTRAEARFIVIGTDDPDVYEQVMLHTKEKNNE
jgi:hypothetical protein